MATWSDFSLHIPRFVLEVFGFPVLFAVGILPVPRRFVRRPEEMLHGRTHVVSHVATQELLEQLVGPSGRFE